MKEATTYPLQACPQWVEKLNAIHHDDLNFEERLALRAHQETCSRCQAVKAEYRALDALITGLPPVKPLPTLPVRLQELTSISTESEPFLKDVALSGQLPPHSLAGRAVSPRRRAGGLARKLNLAAAVLAVLVILGGFLILRTMGHSSNLGSSPQSGGSVTSHSTSVYLATDEARSTVYDVNPRNGSIIWQRNIGQKPVNQPFMADGNLYFPAYDGNIYALRASDGQPLWHTRVAPGTDRLPAGIMQAYGNLIFTGTTDGHLYALNAQTGTVAWQIRMPACPTDGSNPSYTTTQQGQNTTIVHLTGQPDPCNVVTQSAYNGTIYGFADGLYAWNVTNGHVLWHNAQYQFGPQSMLVSHGKVYLATPPSSGYRIDVLDASNGHFLHTLVKSPAVDFTSEVVANGTTLYVAGTTSLFAYRLSDDSLLWKADKPFTNLAVAGTSIYATYGKPASSTASGHSTYTIYLYALNAANGAQLWHIQYPPSTFLNPRFEVGGILITVSDTGIHALQASDGKRLWQAFQNKQIQWPVAG